MANVYFLPIEMYRSNQTIFIAADIEHDQISDSIHARKNHTQCVEAFKMVFLHQMKPMIQSRLAIRIALRELPERFPRNNVHARITLLLTALL